MGFSASGILSDTDATDRLGRSLARRLQPSDVVLLSGQIGTGKTHLARAIIRALFAEHGLDQVDIPSPSYTLVQTYDLPNCSVWHADLYRLGDPSEIAELGLDAAFEANISLVEWPELLETPPSTALRIALDVKDTGRRVRLSSNGKRWGDLTALLEVLDA